MITALQIVFILVLIVVIIYFVFQPRQPKPADFPEQHRDILHDYVSFYNRLDEDAKKVFELRMQRFLSATKITGVNADVEELDLVLIAAAAIIPVFFIRDWEYVNLREVLVYPGNFNQDFDQEGTLRNVTGMVGTGPMQNVMILSKWELRQGFLHQTNRNTAIHEFVHLVDKMDGYLDGVPEILLERKFVPAWRQLLQETIENIRQGRSDIDAYGANNPVECFAVVAEYFFEQPELFAERHPELNALLKKIFVRT